MVVTGHFLREFSRTSQHCRHKLQLEITTATTGNENSKNKKNIEGMETLDDVILEPIENLFDAMGMMQGEAAPLKRAAAGVALGYAIAYGIKPSFAFTADGKEKVFAGTSSAKDDPDATWFPAWAVVVVPAVIFSVLI